MDSFQKTDSAGDFITPQLVAVPELKLKRTDAMETAGLSKKASCQLRAKRCVDARSNALNRGTAPSAGRTQNRWSKAGAVSSVPVSFL
jgi:hypothetical protein